MCSVDTMLNEEFLKVCIVYLTLVKIMQNNKVLQQWNDYEDFAACEAKRSDHLYTRKLLLFRFM